MKGSLYLIPSTLGDTSSLDVLPPVIQQVAGRLKYFIVEDIRTARRFLKKIEPGIIIDDLNFLILNEHTAPDEIPRLLKPMLDGSDAGLLSEAGLPCIADPGAALADLAHENDIRVVPLPGPSSIFLALMASGFNGQNFAFHGYLPIDKNERQGKLRELEQMALQKNQTQIFIETPYRNAQMIEALIRSCKPATRVCIACDLTLPSELILQCTVSKLSANKPELGKKPAVFLLYR